MAAGYRPSQSIAAADPIGRFEAEGTRRTPDRYGGTAAYTRQIEALLERPDAQSVLPPIQCPVFVVAGEEDQWSPPHQLEAIAEAIPNAELRILPRAGHMAPAEDPWAFNAVVRDSMDWSPARGRGAP